MPRRPSADSKPLDDDGYVIRKNKSQLHREAMALFNLAEQLLKRKPQELAAWAIPEEIVAEMNRARTIRAHGARKRQMQFLAKLFRDWQSHDPQAIRHLIDKLNVARES